PIDGRAGDHALRAHGGRAGDRFQRLVAAAAAADAVLAPGLGLVAGTRALSGHPAPVSALGERPWRRGAGRPGAGRLHRGGAPALDEEARARRSPPRAVAVGCIAALGAGG